MSQDSRQSEGHTTLQLKLLRSYRDSFRYFAEIEVSPNENYARFRFSGVEFLQELHTDVNVQALAPLIVNNLIASKLGQIRARRLD